MTLTLRPVSSRLPNTTLFCKGRQVIGLAKRCFKIDDRQHIGWSERKNRTIELGTLVRGTLVRGSLSGFAAD